MTESELNDLAARRTTAALESAGMADPRPHYRDVLRRLKSADPAAFAEATDRFEQGLVPAVASADRDPVLEWIAYGRWLAGRSRSGRFVGIDPTGRAGDAAERHDPAYLLLHLPDDTAEPAFVIASPADPTPPQEATIGLLIRPRTASA